MCYKSVKCSCLAVIELVSSVHEIAIRNSSQRALDPPRVEVTSLRSNAPGARRRNPAGKYCTKVMVSGIVYTIKWYH